jgi:DNA-binding transcriptional LysR family regulator
MFDWDDLKPFLAVARHGSTLAAARAMGINQSTVQRRLAELERRLGHRLVERNPGGYRLTALGTAMLADAEAIAARAEDFERNLRERARTDAAVLRLTCPEPIALRLTQSGLLERFRNRYPGIAIEFVLSDRYVDLARGEADVALRSGDTDDGDLVGRKIAESLWAIYASRGYVERHGAPSSVAEIATHPLIGFDETRGPHRISTWFARVAPDAVLAARNNSVLGLVYAARSGVGLAPLPTAIGDDVVDLVRVLGPVPELTRAWRVLAHPDRRGSVRVAAFFDFVQNEIEALRRILTG